MKNFANQQIASLQGLRAIAFLMVLLGHCSVRGMENLSGVAVSLFFVLSGFVLSYSYRNRTLPGGLRRSVCFAGSRIKKLYILHLLLLAAMIILEVMENDGFYHEGKTVMINALLLQAWFPNTIILHSFNGITWYLSAALFLYFLFPIIERGIRKYEDVHQAILGVCVIVLVRIIWSWVGNLYIDVLVIRWFQYFFPITRIWEFVIGCHIAYIYRCHRWPEISSKLGTVLEFVTLLFLFFSWQMMKSVEEWAKYVVIIPAVIFAVYFLAQSRGIISCFLSHRIWTKLGDVSGYTYIIHYVVLRYLYLVLYRFDIEKTPPIFVAVITFVVTLFLTYLYIRIVKIVKVRKRPAINNSDNETAI